MLYKSLVRSHFEYGFLCYAADDKLLGVLEKIQNKCMRLVTGAFRTTSIVSLQVECNLPPLAVRLSYLKERFVLKLYSELNNFLLSDLINLATQSIRKPFYLSKGLADFMIFIERFNIHRSICLPCYEGLYQSRYPPMNIYVDNSLSKNENVYEKMASWNDHRFVYTDGAKNESNVSFAIYDSYLKLGVGFKLDEHASIFTVETVAILSALKHIHSHRIHCRKWVIVSDSMSVLQILKSNKINADTNYLIYAIKNIWFELFSISNTLVDFLWTPSHIGVIGNEKVDFLARCISNSTEVVTPPEDSFSVSLPYTDVISLLKQRMCNKWKRHRDFIVQIENKGTWYAALGIKLNTVSWFCKGNSYINRKFYTTICRLRFGHCRLNHHLYRMNIVNSSHCDWCQSQEDQTIDHLFFSCSSFGIQRLVLMDELIRIYGEPGLVPRNIQDLLKKSSTYPALYSFILSTAVDV